MKKYNTKIWVFEKFITFKKKIKKSVFTTNDIKQILKIKNPNELILLWKKYEFIIPYEFIFKNAKKRNKEYTFNIFTKIPNELKYEILRLTTKESELKEKLKEIRKKKRKLEVLYKEFS